LNLGELWQSVTAPVLVIHGSADSIMSRADSEAIAAIVNQVHPGHARYWEVENMAHDFTGGMKFDAEVVATVLSWMKEQMAR